MTHHTTTYKRSTFAVSIALLLHTGGALKANDQKVGDDRTYVEVSIAEAVDKWTILKIKELMIKDPEKLKNVKNELQALDTLIQKFSRVAGIPECIKKLQAINQRLWDIEDVIREKEIAKDFGQQFVEIARSVYHTNDERFAVKQKINQLCGSRLVEEKIHPDYHAKPQAQPTPAAAAKRSIPSPEALTAEKRSTLLSAAQKAINERNKEAALEHLTTLLKHEPDNPAVLSVMGTVQSLARNYTDACRSFLTSIRARPSDLHTVSLLCDTLTTLGRFDAALPLLEALYRSNPAGYKIRMLMAYLREGDFEKAAPLIDMTNQWNGENLAGKTAIVNLKYDVGSNGYGDALQIIRLAKEMHYDAGARVIIRLLGHPHLQTIFRLCPYVAQVITENDPVPTHDRMYTPSVAATMVRCAHNPDKQKEPYLHADANLVQMWQRELAQDRNFKVGIRWSRGYMRDFFGGNIAPCPRSMAKEALAPLAKIEGVTFYTMHENPAENTNFPDGLNVRSFGPSFDKEHGSFMDTAALMKNLDLVITIDTSIGHLAGGLGVPVWLLTPSGSDYRWLRNRDDSIWYPTMRFFKQTEAGKWDDVITRVCEALNLTKTK